MPPLDPCLEKHFGEADFARFQQRVERDTGIRLNQYKPDQMRRRLTFLARKAGCVSFAAFESALARDPLLRAEFVDRTTINVTHLLRNPHRFDELMTFVLPELLAARNGASLSVWSAGCSYGAEAYTLAMLLCEAAPVPRHRILGTDVDPQVLARAECPVFSAADMIHLSPRRCQTYFQQSGGCFQPLPRLRGMIRFGSHDLLADLYPDAEHDLIVCRNVVIYFTDEAKERIYRGFFRALKPGGVLFVGGTERLSDHHAVGFELLRPFFYRKPSP